MLSIRNRDSKDSYECYNEDSKEYFRGSIPEGIYLNELERITGLKRENFNLMLVVKGMVNVEEEDRVTIQATKKIYKVSAVKTIAKDRLAKIRQDYKDFTSDTIITLES